MMDNVVEEKVITVEVTRPGYAHTRFSGTYSGPVTVKDIEERFYNKYFGGRDVHCAFGKWSCTRHDD